MCTTDDANGPSRGHQERRPTTVAGVVKTFTQTRTDLELYAEQGRRWQALELGATRRRDVERYVVLVAQELLLVEQILALAEELKSGTIERMLAKSDLELGWKPWASSRRRPLLGA
jgi:hypothetical protein